MSNAGDGDKRKVSTDALETLGNIIGPDERRDAIHLAVEPIVAGQLLAAGQDVGLVDGRAFITKPEHLVGIVDPFLKEPVRPGQRFWLIVYPRQIHSLRHVWTHPAFPDVPEVAGEAPKAHVDPKAASEQWIRNYAARIDLGYNRLMAGADDWLESKKNSSWGDYLVEGGTLEGVTTDPEFWTHYAIVRGVDVPTEHRQNFFSCSC